MGCMVSTDRTATRVAIEKGKFISFEKIKQTIEEHFKTTMDILVTPCRRRECVYPRQMMMYFLVHHTRMSLKLIGETFSRDHTTVINAAKAISDQMDVYPNTKFEVDEITEKLFA